MRTSPERNVLGCQHVKKESPLDLRGQGVLEKTFGEAQISYNEAILEKGKRHRTPPINMQCHDVWSP